MLLRDLNLEQIVLKAAQRADEVAAMRAKVPSLDCPIILTDEPRMAVITDHLQLRARIVMASVTEGAISLCQVARATGLDDDEVVRIAYVLFIKGVLHVESVTPVGSEPSSVTVLKTGGLLSPRRPLVDGGRALTHGTNGR